MEVWPNVCNVHGSPQAEGASITDGYIIVKEVKKSFNDKNGRMEN